MFYLEAKVTGQEYSSTNEHLSVVTLCIVVKYFLILMYTRKQAPPYKNLSKSNVVVVTMTKKAGNDRVLPGSEVTVNSRVTHLDGTLTSCLGPVLIIVCLQRSLSLKGLLLLTHLLPHALWHVLTLTWTMWESQSVYFSGQEFR